MVAKPYLHGLELARIRVVKTGPLIARVLLRQVEIRHYSWRADGHCLRKIDTGTIDENSKKRPLSRGRWHLWRLYPGDTPHERRAGMYRDLFEHWRRKIDRYRVGIDIPSRGAHYQTSLEAGNTCPGDTLPSEAPPTTVRLASLWRDYLIARESSRQGAL